MKKVSRTKRIVAFMLAMTMVLTTVLCDTGTVYAAGSKAVKTVSLKIGSKKVTKKTYSLAVGKTATIKTTVSPKSAKKSIAYKSDNKNVATVSKTGKITAKKAGTTKITVTVTGKNKKKKKAWVKIKVTEVAVKKLTLNKTSLSLKEGASETLKATVSPSNATTKTVTWSTSNNNVATVSQTGTVTAKKAGTAVITAKSKNGKTASCSVTVMPSYVATTGITLSPNKVELSISQTTNLTPTISPANATNRAVTWSSSNEAVAEVSASGVVTGKGPGTATVTATTADGKSASCAVTVSSYAVNANVIEIEVTNPYKDPSGNVYENTVLVGNEMSVRTRVIKDGQPLGKTKVTLRATPLFGNAPASFVIRDDYEETDENGYATFTIGPSAAAGNVDAVSGLFQSYEITASVPGQSEMATIKFASIVISNLWNENGWAAGDAIDPSDNASPADDGLAITSSLGGVSTQEYVTSQKVSASDGTDDNKVYFDVAPYLLLPATRENAHTGDWEVDFTGGKGTSGSYSVYNDSEKTTTIVEDVPAGLQFITVYFSKRKMSKYTALYIDVYSAEDRTYGTLLRHEERTYEDNCEDDAIQLSVQEDQKSFIVVSIISEGMVDASNEGYTLTKMVGKWATSDSEQNTLVELEGCVTWEDVSSSLAYENKGWTYAEACKYLPAGSEYLNKNYQYSYKVPVFPYTGNAVITVKDANDNLKAYYTYPTVRDTQAGNVNVNILAPAPANTVTGEYAVFVSSDGVSQRDVGSMTQSGNMAIVDAKKTGFTELKATIKVPGLSKQELNDQNGGELYTFVQWAPISSKEESEVIPDYFAVEGQDVTVTAQLYDQNGNKAPLSDKAVNFFYIDEDGDQQQITHTGQEIGGNAGQDTVTVSQYASSTDSEGRIKITLTGNSIDYVEGIEAKTSGGYKVGLTFDGSDPGEKLTNTNGNVYWVDLGVTYVDSAVATDMPTRTSWFENSSKAIAKKPSSKVDATWHIGYIPVARSHKFNFTHNLVETHTFNGVVDINMHDDPLEFISVSGVELDYSTDRSSKAEMKELGNNVVSLYSKIIGASTLTGIIDPESISEETTFIFYDEDMNPLIYKNVGKGTPTVDNTGLELTLNWALNGMDARIITPAGRALDLNTNSVVYVEVYDSFENKAKDISVKYTITGPNATAQEVERKTDEFGIVKIPLPAPKAAGTSVISITVGDDIKQSVSISYSAASNAAFGLSLDKDSAKEYAVEVTGDKELTVYFNSRINADTIKAGEFTFTEDGNAAVTYTVVDAAIGKANNAVVLTLDQAIVNSGAQHTLSIASWTDTNGIVYEIMDGNGQKISAAAGVNQGSSYTFKPSERTAE